MPPSPPPAAFSFTAGSFDYPSASPPPLSGLGSAIRSMRRASRPADAPTLEATAPARRRRQLHRLLGPPRDSDAADDDLARRPTTANPNHRLRATPSERYLRRSQARIREQRAADMDSTDSLLDALATAPARSLFALSNPPPAARARSPPGPLGAERRHAKRRKLDHDAGRPSEHDGFRYGYKGQVVPGRLRMEIVSCDGGEYPKDNPSGLYKVQNVLKNDKSVYCSESARCNLLLRHMGDAPFALDRLVIRAPDRGFTAPVQEGLVFVSMCADELLAGTAAYQLQYRPHAPLASLTSPTPSSAADNEHLSLQEAIDDPTIWHRIRRTSADTAAHRIERIRDRNRHLARDSHLRHHLDSPGLPFLVDTADDTYAENCDDLPPFTVTTASEDDEPDSSEDVPSAAIIADRLRRESRWRAQSDDDDEDDDMMPRFGGFGRGPALDYTSYDEWREPREPRRATQLGGPSRIEPTDMSSGGEGVIAPHARFFIKKNRHKITIKFQPAISGRHVLLKLWSPTHDGNIDIESVQFYGFSGPRYFPATNVC